MSDRRNDLRSRDFATTYLANVGEPPRENLPNQYARAEDEATAVSRDNSKLQLLVENVKGVASWGKLGQDAMTLCEMAEMHYKKKWIMDYRDLILVTTCLVYIATPVDAIPDAIPVVGYVDDALVVRYTVSTIGTNMDRFKAWKEGNPIAFQQGKDEQCCEDCVIL